ncbi:GNAT family N-acetyltransferase [Nonomuraea sp. K274]|uniref:GNAT family N-acetyltransferase n=1 Tax=Nonomuraea cypriaca TaxID=1187855 RepID=A0A931AC92_9ACTN|nr:GNAT family N-acetyltransferase [Nonomuraea cypriaca]MBF8187375.1 GNAT family N-acetyltransferase [Nonomuraea cypriaca]
MNYDLLVHAAWPAYEQRVHDGWVLRYAGGVTKRANSVLALDEPGDLDAAIEVAEKFYAERGERCVFSMGAGVVPGLDEELARRGYELTDPTVIMAGAPSLPPAGEVRVEERPWKAWLDTWWAVDGRYGTGYEAAERICTGVPAWYGAVERDGVAVAVGRAVPQGEAVGIYCMATRPEARRQGLARDVLRALLRRCGGGTGYLVTTAGNTAAQALYRAEGFDVVGGYHYRIR